MDQDVVNQTPRQRIIDAARGLFDAKGFHSTPVSELACVAGVSVGQIYRLFPGKDDVILAIVEDDTKARIAEMQEVFEAVERNERSVYDALKEIARTAIVKSFGGLSFEILAEAYRNPSVAERLATLTNYYRDGARRLATLARPDGTVAELDAYVEIMMACFVGLGHRTLFTSAVDVDQASHETACLILRALGVADICAATQGNK